jgi:hypothetical protein
MKKLRVPAFVPPTGQKQHLTFDSTALSLLFLPLRTPLGQKMVLILEFLSYNMLAKYIIIVK